MKTSRPLLATVLVCAVAASAVSKDAFTDTFAVDRGELTSVGTNRFFILTPGHQLILEGKDGGKAATLTITVLDETKSVDEVETRVVEERETVGGELKEVSRNYFAISRRTADVYYFGEDVDLFKEGKVSSHEGAWLSGVNGAHFGLMMPGTPLLGARYFQELAPPVAMDRAEVVSLNEELKTPAGQFADCLKTEETSAIENGHEYKLYAADIGLIQDGGLRLKRAGFVNR